MQSRPMMEQPNPPKILCWWFEQRRCQESMLALVYKHAWRKDSAAKGHFSRLSNYFSTDSIHTTLRIFRVVGTIAHHWHFSSLGECSTSTKVSKIVWRIITTKAKEGYSTYSSAYGTYSSTHDIPRINFDNALIFEKTSSNYNTVVRETLLQNR